MVSIGYGVEKQIDDILLTRYACYLIAQNGDSRKLQVAFAQTYFAVQTRKAEVIEQRLLDCDMLLQSVIKPERLSPDEDIKKVQRRINKDNKKNLKNK